MASLICEYCNKTYSSISSLNNHKKTTKKCLDIQKNLNKIIVMTEFNCKYCNKVFTTKQNIKIHETNCRTKKRDDIEEQKENYIELQKEIVKLNDRHKLEIKNLNEKYELELKKYKEQSEKEIQKYIDKNEDLDSLLKEYLNEIQKLREVIAGLQGELKISNKTVECVYEIAKQPKNITNCGTNTNNTNNSNNKTLNITSSLDFKNIDKIKEIINEKYDINHFLSGQKGCAQFAAQHLLIDENGNYIYLCSDPSRYSFRYKNENGEIEKDLEAKKLTTYLVNGGIKEKAKIVSLDWCQNNGVIDPDRFLIVTEKQDSILNLKYNNNEFKRELAAIIS